MGSFARTQRALDDEPAPLPLPPGPISNGEFVPASATAVDRAVARLIRSNADDAARRAGLSRRRFLQGAGAVALSLAAFDLANRAGATSSGPRQGIGPGGTFRMPAAVDVAADANVDAVMTDTSIAAAAHQLIVDVHTHFATPTGAWVRNAPETVGLILGMLPAGCSDPDRLDCVDQSAYLHDVFLASDTTMAVLTDVPSSGASTAPLPFTLALETERIAGSTGQRGARRVLAENVIAPNVGPLEACLDEMTAAAETRGVAAFKVYTAWSPTGRGFSLASPSIGMRTVQHTHDLGVKVFVAHKGLPLVNFDPAFNHPDDVVAVSRHFRDMQFVIYHAAWDPSHVEGPYDPHATTGIDSLLASLDHHHVAANDNVWVDTASMWRQLLTVPDQAAHALGKLLKRVGERRVLWGTDSIWFGSPQPQIVAMRAFEISAEYQARYGYPALTSALKARLFGLNAAELFGFEDAASLAAIAADPLTGRAEAAALRGDGALPSPWAARGPITRRQVLGWLPSLRGGWLPV